jgi:hypothetical protein
MPQAYRIHGRVSPEGSLKLENLPFEPRASVEVVVRADERHSGDERYPLRGTPVVYHDPTSPVVEADWHTLEADPLIVTYPHVQLPSETRMSRG